MITFCLYSSAVGALLFSKRTLGDYFSPLAVYLFFWCFALGSFYLNWISFDLLGSEVITAIGIATGMFVAGALIPVFYAWSRPAAFRDPPSMLHHVDRSRLEMAMLFLFGLGVFGFAVQLVHLQMEVGLSAFITAPQRVRDVHSNVKYLGFFDILNLANFVMGTVYVTLFKRPKWWVVGMLVFAILTTFFSTDRTRFFYTVIWAFYAVVYSRKQVRITRQILLGGLLTMGALIGFFLLIAKIYVKQAFEDNMEYIKISQDYALAIDPYIYLTGSFPVFQAFLNDEFDHTYGKYTFEPLVKVIEVIYPDLSRAEIVGKFYRVPVELNAGTYLQPYVLDWGIFGLWICPFLVGLSVMMLYLAMRARKSLFLVYTTALFSFCTTISIFVNHFSQTATWFFVIVGYVVHRFCTDPSHQATLRKGVG
ncbi:MAG: oligosaccharide repeat unit polymerase [Acidobacteria bacterium]|nr:oligosaccharide repeat unit polymerase [Acidobacteriota bacterium]